MINVICEIFGCSGYSIHSRNLVKALDKQTEIRLSCNLPPNWNREVSDRELELIKRKPQKDEINLIITNPLYWNMHLNGKENWVYFVFEGDKAPKCWIEACKDHRINKIIVPSEHTYNSIVNSVINDSEIISKVIIAHHGVDLDLFYPMYRE